MIPLISTVIVCFVFIGMAIGYTQKRANQSYAENKSKAPSLNSFRTLSKVLFVFGMVFTLFSYWLDFPPIFLFHDSSALRLAGALTVLLGYFGLQHAFASLGQNYSPLFDAYKPLSITKSGIYHFIRHPIYLFNLFVSFGLALSSGLYPVIISASIGLVFIIRAVIIEERYLKQEFAGYEIYCSRTWRFIPYLV